MQRSGVTRWGWWLCVLLGAGVLPAAGEAWPLGPWDPFSSWHRVELDWVAQFQAVPGLGWLMQGFSALGPGRYLAAAIACLFLAWDARLGTRLAVLLVSTLWLRELLALGFESPRPFWYGAPIHAYSEDGVARTTYSFPSGHALVGTAVWMFLAAQVRRPWAWSVAGLVAVGICVSRPYLGMHYPSDVVAGAAIGGLCAWAFPRAERAWLRGWRTWSVGRRRVIVCGAALLVGGCGWGLRHLTGVPPGDAPEGWAEYFRSSRSLGSQARLAGIAIGMGWAVAGQSEWPRVSGPWWWRGIRLAVVGGLVKGVLQPLGRRGLAWFPESESELLHWIVAMLLHAGVAWLVWAALPTWLGMRGGTGHGARPGPASVGEGR